MMSVGNVLLSSVTSSWIHPDVKNLYFYETLDVFKVLLTELHYSIFYIFLFIPLK